MNLSPDIIRQAVANLFIQFPELAESDDIQFRVDMLLGETNLFEFLEDLVRKMRERQAHSNAITDYIKELCDRQARLDAGVAAHRALIFKLMEAANLQRAPLATATLTISNGQRKVIGDADPATLPDNLVRIKRELNKTAIKEALEAGEEVPGFQLSNGEATLSIRTK